MSNLLPRSPSIGSPPARHHPRPGGSPHARRLIVDASIDAVTADLISSRWSITAARRDGDRYDVEELVVDRAALSASAVVAGHEGRAWIDLVLRSLARHTNLLLASSRFLVVGGGAIADGFTAALTRFGGRVEVASDDPVELVSIAHRYGVSAHHITGAGFVGSDVAVLIATGRSHPPLTADALAAGRRPLIVVNAAPPPDGSAGAFHADETSTTVRELTEFSGPRPIFAVPPVDASALDDAAADVRASFALLLATVGPEDADRELAKALLT